MKLISLYYMKCLLKFILANFKRHLLKKCINWRI